MNNTQLYRYYLLKKFYIQHRLQRMKTLKLLGILKLQHQLRNITQGWDLIGIRKYFEDYKFGNNWLNIVCMFHLPQQHTQKCIKYISYYFPCYKSSSILQWN